MILLNKNEIKEKWKNKDDDLAKEKIKLELDKGKQKTMILTKKNETRIKKWKKNITKKTKDEKGRRKEEKQRGINLLRYHIEFLTMKIIKPTQVTKEKH